MNKYDQHIIKALVLLIECHEGVVKISELNDFLSELNINPFVNHHRGNIDVLYEECNRYKQ